LDPVFVRCEQPAAHPHVLVVTIDRPPANAMSLDAHRQLLSALRSTETDDGIRCIVLTGAGDKAFVAGGDVGELGALDPQTALVRTRVIRQVFDAIRRNPVPVIAAVNGAALGGGMVMVSVCDIVVAADSARFGLPEINVGVMGGTKHLARIVPEKVMRWMALTGKRVDAAYLERLGVILALDEAQAQVARRQAVGEARGDEGAGADADGGVTLREVDAVEGFLKGDQRADLIDRAERSAAREGQSDLRLPRAYHLVLRRRREAA
jgi:enoyl-CoA hydratase